MKKPPLLFILVLLHLFIGFAATAGGAMLVIRPDGSLLGMHPDWLANSPFADYLIPGLLLLCLTGILSLLTAAGLFFKPAWKLFSSLNLYPDKHGAWAFSLYTGIVSISWIAIQQVLTRYFWIQPVIVLIGLLIIIITLSPALIREFQYKVSPQTSL